MIVHLLVAKIPGEEPWVVDAVDEWTRDENDAAMPDAELRARRSNGKHADIRWLDVEIPDDALASVFRTRVVKGERIADLEARLSTATALVRKAAESSVVTMSDDPGCFYCDHEEHTAECPAAKFLGEPVDG